MKLHSIARKSLFLTALFLFKTVFAFGLTITATISPLRDLAKRLVPEEKIHLLIPPGADFHHFEPSFKDFKILYQSDLILAVGTEPWLKGSDLKGKTLALTQDTQVKNPHLWLDLKRVEIFVDKLAGRLATLKPSEKTEIERRAQEVRGEIEKIRRELKRLAGCGTKKVVILGHAAMGYLLQEAGLEEVALAGPHPEGEVPPAKLHQILALVQKEHIPAIFLLDPPFRKYLPVFRKIPRIQILTLNPGIPLWPQEQNLDFFGLLHKNLRHLKKGLCPSNLPSP